MRDGHRPSQSERPRRRRHVLRRQPWGRRTFQDPCVTAGAIQFHPQAFNYLIDPQYLACQPALNAWSGVAMVDITAPMRPGWPSDSMRWRKNSRFPRPIGPQRADRRRLVRSSGPWRRHPHPGGIGDVKSSPADAPACRADRGWRGRGPPQDPPRGDYRGLSWTSGASPPSPRCPSPRR
jgi:hypothetical protein